MRFALMVEPQQGIPWSQQVALAQRAEAAGFGTLYRSDHYESFPGAPGRPTSDGFAVIAGLVRETGRLRHGTLVSPVTFRHPAAVARMVATIDEMSDGRVELGLGAGWHEDEHRRHGFPFPPMATRLEMLEEQLAVVAGLWSGKRGWSFEGTHYRVEDAWFVPSFAGRPRPPLVVGTRGARRGIRMAAQHADHLNVYYTTPAKARAAFAALDEECRAIGRDPASVTRSVLLGTVVGEDRGRADARRAAIAATFAFPGSPAEWQAANEHVWIVGTPDEARATVHAYRDAGADLVIFQDFLPEDMAMIDLLGTLATEWAR